jgi:hypothetical protein
VSEQPGRYQRSAAGMVGALVVLLAVIGGFVLLRDVNRTNPPSPVTTVDYQKVVPFAKRQAHFQLVAPVSLPRGWRATTVNFTDGPDEHWHLGCLTDQDRYVGLEQGDQSVAAMLKAYVDPSPSHGAPVLIGGQRWASYTDSGDDLALVRRTGRTTTLVVGHDVPQQVLVTYIGSLR